MSKEATAAQTVKVPNFADDLLPVGDYSITFAELYESVLVNGCGELKNNWDRDWRAKLVSNLEIMVSQLWNVGVSNIYIDGSFVENKDHPNDIDGYFECDMHRLTSGELERELNALESAKIWTWDPATRKAYRGYHKKQLPMWHHYRVELYPHCVGMGCGIVDKQGNQLEFPSAFRMRRSDDKPKGIIKITK